MYTKSKEHSTEKIVEYCQRFALDKQSKNIGFYLRSLAITLIFHPAYCPIYNPIECVLSRESCKNSIMAKRNSIQGFCCVESLKCCEITKREWFLKIVATWPVVNLYRKGFPNFTRRKSKFLYFFFDFRECSNLFVTYRGNLQTYVNVHGTSLQ